MNVTYRLHRLAMRFQSTFEVCQSPPRRVWTCDIYAPPWGYPTFEAVTVGDMTDYLGGFGFVKEGGGLCVCQDCDEGDVVLVVLCRCLGL